MNNQANVPVDINMAFSLYQQGQFSDALSHCDTLIGRNKNTVDALNLAGIISDSMNKKEKAISYFERALKINPSNPQILTNLAGTLIDVERFSDAKKYLLKATQKNRNYADAHYNLGNIHLFEEQNEKAKKAYQTAVTLNPKNFRALNNLATIFKKLRDSDNAIKAYQDAIKIKPNFPESLEGLGSIYFEKEDYQKAEQYFLEALKIDNKLANANFLLGKIYLENMDKGELALPHINAAYQSTPKDTNIVNMLAKAFYEQGNLIAAKDLFTESLVLEPEQISPLNYMGQISQELREYEKGIEYFEVALSLEPENSKVMNNYGHLLREKGDIKKAINIFNQSITIDRDLPIEERSTALNNLSLTQLLEQNFSNGWNNYRFRPSIMDSELPSCPDREYIELKNKRILWLQDQGIGDELFFLRFIPTLNKLNTKNSYKTNEKLKSLINDINLFEAVITGDYDNKNYDYVISIGDLPYLLGHTSRQNTPSPLTLKPDIGLKGEIESMLREFGPPPYIGITWKAGRLLNNKRVGAYHKHIDLSHLSELIAPLGGTVISLQINADKSDLESLSAKLGKPILDVSSFHNQLNKMLCLLDILDHYVAVSNTYVHMRESLSKESIVFINSPPEWRWLSDGDTSFWMPKSIIHRQDINGSWQAAMSKCKNTIEVILEHAQQS